MVSATESAGGVSIKHSNSASSTLGRTGGCCWATATISMSSGGMAILLVNAPVNSGCVRFTRAHSSTPRDTTSSWSSARSSADVALT
eukprot:CAMPEP_0205901126 /NCGR_PEP_ID=MMETSP1083-20121108/27512_1 /ASSEMBLY_ACC=CAM_ASM_000430 /TAXON_ID=97485 /ORGANISM="Prymnesium parvum, Strain Texoma1" /LENGTH=86 /DNA_ID=CAMNT_0053266627 /DNA_START=302 /DNA_END=562 /DNA_ORIENTATION=+